MGEKEIVETWVPCVSQRAETQRIARGFGVWLEKLLSSSVNAFFWIAFIGEPWPIKTTGIDFIR